MGNNKKKIRQIDLVIGVLVVFKDVLEERNQQMKEYGGADHDDKHVHADWLDMIDYQLGKYSAVNGTSKTIHSGDERQQLVKIAALAVAAIESYDRINK